MKTKGLHHVTAITRDLQKNYDFYTRILGLHLVKRTVNFDDPTSYHFYYGNSVGSPGTILTFFDWPQTSSARPGAGQVIATAYTIPHATAQWWYSHLLQYKVAGVCQISRMGASAITFRDPDGMTIELIEAAGTDTPDTHTINSAHFGNSSDNNSQSVFAEYALQSLHSVTLLLRKYEATARLLVEHFGYTPGPVDQNRHRYIAAGSQTCCIDILVQPDAPRGSAGAGSVHHIAFRCDTDAEHVQTQQHLQAAGFQVSPVMERHYFRSIYFREPAGVLFEVATDAPGFTVDEPIESLGTSLKLPAQYELHRTHIEALLPVVVTD
jgi:glyoxalase family protein